LLDSLLQEILFPVFHLSSYRMEKSSKENDPNLDYVLEGMIKKNEALKKHIDQGRGNRSKSGSSDSSFELEESAMKERKQETTDQKKEKDIESKLKVFAREAPKFKFIPDPEKGGNSQSFDKNIKEAFEKVLPEKIVESLSSKKCGLCNEPFEELKWAHRHYTGYNHKGAIKSFIRGTLRIHPPYFKMVWEALLSPLHTEGMTGVQIFVYVMQKFNVGEDIEKVEQFIKYGIERLLANEFIEKKDDVYKVVDASRALDIKSGAARVLSAKATGFREFETNILDQVKDELSSEVLKTLKPDYCGLCHTEIKDSAWEKHYSGHSHKRTVELFKAGKYLGHPSYNKMMEQYFANENPETLSEEHIVQFIMKNFPVESDKSNVLEKVQKIIKSILDKPDQRMRDRETRYHESERTDYRRKEGRYEQHYQHDRHERRRSDYRNDVYRRDSRNRSRSRPRDRNIL